MTGRGLVPMQPPGFSKICRSCGRRDAGTTGTVAGVGPGISPACINGIRYFSFVKFLFWQCGTILFLQREV